MNPMPKLPRDNKSHRGPGVRHDSIICASGLSLTATTTPGRAGCVDVGDAVKSWEEVHPGVVVPRRRRLPRRGRRERRRTQGRRSRSRSAATTSDPPPPGRRCLGAVDRVDDAPTAKAVPAEEGTTAAITTAEIETSEGFITSRRAISRPRIGWESSQRAGRRGQYVLHPRPERERRRLGDGADDGPTP